MYFLYSFFFVPYKIVNLCTNQTNIHIPHINITSFKICSFKQVMLDFKVEREKKNILKLKIKNKFCIIFYIF